MHDTAQSCGSVDQPNITPFQSHDALPATHYRRRWVKERAKLMMNMATPPADGQRPPPGSQDDQSPRDNLSRPRRLWTAWTVASALFVRGLVGVETAISSGGPMGRLLGLTISNQRFAAIQCAPARRAVEIGLARILSIRRPSRSTTSKRRLCTENLVRLI